VNCGQQQSPGNTIDITVMPDTPKSSAPEMWVAIGECMLTAKDKTDLLSGKWLNDRHIDAAQKLLHQQYPEISGFQSCVLQCTRTFSIQKDKSFIQILNINANHWITISTVGCAPGIVKVYDSMHQKLSPEVKRTIADLMQAKQKFLVIDYANVQIQNGVNDCGLLAIAFATAICEEQNPESRNFDQSRLRNHLHTAFEVEVLLPFPSQPIKREACIQKERLKIYCYCRLIDDGRHMIRCNGCEDWFHIDCAQVSSAVLKNKKSSWFCQQCIKQTACDSKISACDYSYDQITNEIRLLKVSLYMYYIMHNYSSNAANSFRYHEGRGAFITE
jgi:hypothetical protein